MRDGFADLATLPADRYHRILAAVTESVGGRVAFKPDEVAIAVGVAGSATLSPEATTQS